MSAGRSALCVIGLGWLAVGCHIGSSAEQYPLARSPSGASGVVRVAHVSHRVELLSVQDSGLVLLTNQRVTYAAYSAIDDATFHGTPVTVRNGDSFTPSDLDRLRLFSRFPQGLDAGLEQRLLDAYRQPALDTLAR